MAPPRLQHVIELPLPATLPAQASLPSAEVEDAVLALFDECAPGLRRYVASFNLAPGATDDVVQEVFLALFRHLSLGRPTTNIKAWLFRVAHNLALKQRLRTVSRLTLEGSWDDVAADGMADRGLNPEERIVCDERQRRLTGALRSMPERDQHCIVLRAEGLRYRDIAKTLGISLGSVAKSMVRAFAGLAAADKE